jgi:hypothetical protein
MTSRYTPLYDSISHLESNHKEPDMDLAPASFPFKQAYRGQLEILSAIKVSESCCITSHTGFGKTPVFLSLTRGVSAIVIEPRKFLQTQVAKYFNDFVLFGRSGYHCPLALPGMDGSKTAAMAPCLLKEDCNGTTYHDSCPNANSTCLNKPCKIFPLSNQKSTICEFDELGRCGENNGKKMSYDDCMDNDAPCGFHNQSECDRAKFLGLGISYKKYPCDKCDYINASNEARRVVRSGGLVVCNFGNFWNLVKDADTVVIDEADLFFREISNAMKLKYSNPKKNPHDDIKTLLSLEVSGLQKAAKDPSPRLRYAATNLLFSAQFLKDNSELCFMYQRKDSYYIEIDPRNTNVLAKKLFKGKRVIIVSATPGTFDLPSYSAEIHQRCGIYFAPVGNLTSRSLKANPYLMSTAAKAIAEISCYMDVVYDADRVVVHCGNIGTHATSLYKILGEQDCTIHESGRLAETIEKYLKSGKKYLLVAAAEHGGDFGWCKLQFILKFPYPNLDERMRTLERAMGPDFKGYYEGEARTRVIQMAGRNVRGFDDFGITVCLDSKVREDYEKHKGNYPDWFRNRVDERCY